MYRRDELAKLFADCEPAVVIAHDDQATTAMEGLLVEKAGRTAHVLSVSARDFETRDEPRVLPVRRETPEGSTDFLAAVRSREGQAPPARSPAPDDLGLLLYTSGTTGQPKGAMLRHSAMVFSSQIFRDWAPVPRGALVLGIAPLFHITGIIAHIGVAFSAKGSLILHYRFEPSLVLDIIREQRLAIHCGGAITGLQRPDERAGRFGRGFFHQLRWPDVRAEHRSPRPSRTPSRPSSDRRCSLPTA